MDNEGYGRSDKKRPINCDIANGADDLDAGSKYILEKTRREEADGLRHLLGRAARRACSPSAIPSAWRASRSTPSSGPARAARRSPSARRSCPSSSRRTAGRSTARSCAASSTATIPAAPTMPPSRLSPARSSSLDDSVPTGTYVDMCSKLPLVDPAKIKVPTIVMRGEFDGIAGIEDLLEFFRLLPHSDKQFTVHGRHLARELPAEELPQRVPHPACVLSPSPSRCSADEQDRFCSSATGLVRGRGTAIPRPARCASWCRYRPAASPTRRRACWRRGFRSSSGASSSSRTSPAPAARSAADFAAKSAPDGHTLVITGTTHLITAHLYKNLAYDVFKDFTHIAMLASGPYVLVVNPQKVPAGSVRELIAMAKAKPGKIDFASSGNGSSQHLVGALFNSMAGTSSTTCRTRAAGRRCRTCSADRSASRLPACRTCCRM